jgi:hypothetical protein
MDEIILLESDTGGTDGILLESGGTDVILLEYVAAPATSNQGIMMMGVGA